ncbi:MAG: hypothetical protein QOH41_620 [Blastocatellia bacterium]|jgi:hypothetical protein|nr:hypothetical protein [Blastocatellia bacterium]
MRTLMTFARHEIEFLLGFLAAIAVYQILTGKINTRGLLKDEHGVFSPGRLQLLLVTLACASYVFSQVLESITLGAPGFPTLDPKWFLALFGSHAIYLGGKSYSLFKQP